MYLKNVDGKFRQISFWQILIDCLVGVDMLLYWCFV